MEGTVKVMGYVKEPLFRESPDPDGGGFRSVPTGPGGGDVPVSGSFQCPGCGVKVVFVGEETVRRGAATASWSGVPCHNCGATYTVDLEVDPPQSDPAKERAR
jgi:hypothetical protein